MRFGSAVAAVIVCGVLSVDAALAESIAKTSFYSGRKSHAIFVDKDHVAVRHTPTSGIHRVATLTDKEAKSFAQVGVDVAPRVSVGAHDEIVGYPVWFDREHRDKGAVGVLTHEIVVRVEAASVVDVIRKQAGFADLRPAGFKKDLFLVKFSSPMAALAAANTLYQTSGVKYAHPNFILPKDFRARPKGPDTEPLFTHQWHLENRAQLGGTAGADINAKSAWDVTTGSSEIIIAALDGGFQMTHPDLDGAWVRNSGEIPSNGVDDDANGYVDDVSGWNFWGKNNDPASGVLDDHGTAVAGLSGARQNSKGVTGVCPQCRILPVVVSWEPAEDAAAFHYASSLGADIITNSWGYPIGTPTTDVVEEAINDVSAHGRGGKGAIVLFAMNNIDQDDCIGDEPDISSLESVVAVSGASDLDKKVSFSAWGDCMEFLSPTYDADRPGIATTDLLGTRGYNNGRYPGDLSDLDYTNDFGGTSAATPIAAGVFALMLSVNDALTRDDALSIVLSTADKIQPALANYDPRTGFSKKYGYGRINGGKAVRAAQVFKKYTRRTAKDAKI